LRGRRTNNLHSPNQSIQPLPTFLNHPSEGIPAFHPDFDSLRALDYLREGDTLVVTRIDRLGRSLRDLQNLVHSLNERGIALHATEQPIDTSTAAGKAFLSMLGVFSEFETNLRRERQAEGIAKAKAAGKYRGRPPVSNKYLDNALKMIDQGVPKAQVARDLGIGRATLYRLLAKAS